MATVVGGRRSGGGYVSSSSDDDNDDDDVGSDEGSVSSSASDEEAGEEHEGSAKENDGHGAVRHDRHANSDSGGGQQRIVRKGNRRKNKKKSKDDLIRRMGVAPSIVLPFDVAAVNNDAKEKDGGGRALEVPSGLLPNNYLHDNPNWKVSDAAKSLLSTWHRLSNDDSSGNNNNNGGGPTVVVILLQSGRFAAAIFSIHSRNHTPKMLAHKTSTRYTVRKGQGGSQSQHDQSKSKAKSIGSQLRRDGERQLREDVRKTWKEWRDMGYVDRIALAYVSCPRAMRRDYLHGDDGDAHGGGGGLLGKGDDRWRNVPLDAGRPTLEATSAVFDCVMRCAVRDMTEDERMRMRTDSAVGEVPADENDCGEKDTDPENEKRAQEIDRVSEESAEEEEAPPFTPLHEAVAEGDLSRLLELLQLLDESEERTIDETPARNPSDDRTTTPSLGYDINTRGGSDHQTPLHLASSSTRPSAPSLVNALLLQGRADPCAEDARGRPPYFVASTDGAREAFRLARGALGEGHCRWDEDAKVGPALNDADVRAKKARAAEKKRRQRARQKERKAEERADAERAAAEERKESARREEEEDARRVRDGLKPKKASGGASNACDFCQKVVRGKRRSQMFQRLEYAYCRTECVRRHQRELMAAAATARMG